MVGRLLSICMDVAEAHMKYIQIKRRTTKMYSYLVHINMYRNIKYIVMMIINFYFQNSYNKVCFCIRVSFTIAVNRSKHYIDNMCQVFYIDEYHISSVTKQ